MTSLAAPLSPGRAVAHHIVFVDEEPAGTVHRPVVRRRLPVVGVDMPPFVGRRY